MIYFIQHRFVGHIYTYMRSASVRLVPWPAHRPSSALLPLLMLVLLVVVALGRPMLERARRLLLCLGRRRGHPSRRGLR